MSLFDLFTSAAEEPEEPEKLHAAWEAGHAIGEFLNDHFVQPYLDQHQAGSGETGAEYLHWINDHSFDPIHPLDSLPVHLETEHVDTTQHHDHYDPGPVHDDSADHYQTDHLDDYNY